MEGSSFDVSRRGQLSNQESCRRIRFLDSAITSNSYEFYFISILSSFLLLFFFGGKFEKRRNVISRERQWRRTRPEEEEVANGVR